jgi:Na+/proline symporter/signal transduction histidine kinase/ActR/RegA family two-component response regulator
MVEFIGADVAIVVVYLLGTLVVGYRYGKGVKTIQDYALGGRNFNTATLAATISATTIGAGWFVSAVENSYRDGFWYFFACFGSVVDLLVTGYIFAPRMVDCFGKLSIAEVMGDLYGKSVRIISAITGIALSTGWVALQLKVLSSLVSYFSGFSPELSVISCTLVVVIYSIFGGVRAVTFTDVIQFLSFMLAIFSIFFVLWEKVDFLHKPENLTLAINHAFTLTPKSGEDYYTLLFYFLLPVLDPSTFQRILMGKNSEQVVKAFGISAAVLFFFLCVSSLIGVMLFIQMPNVEDQIFAIMVQEFSVPWIRGVIFIAIVAMAMSTMDSCLNSAAVIFSYDLCKSLESIKKYKLNEVLISRIFTVIVGIIATILAMSFSSLPAILLFANNFYAPIVTVPVILTIMGFRSSSSKPVLIGMAAGFITVVSWKLTIQPATGIDSLIPGMFAHLVFFIGSHYLLGYEGGWLGPKNTAPLELARRDRAAAWAKIKSKFLCFNDAISWTPGNNLHIYTLPGMQTLLGVLIITSYFAITISNASLSPNSGSLYFLQVTSCVIGATLITAPLWASFCSRYLPSIVLYSLIYLIYSNAILMFYHEFSSPSMLSFLVNILACSFFSGALISTIVTLIGLIIGVIQYQLSGHIFIFSTSNITLLSCYGSFALAFILLPFMQRQQDEIESLSESGERLAYMNEMLNSELQLSQGNVQRSMNMQKNIIRNINHEIRTPMSVLLTNSETLLDHIHNPGRLSQKETVAVVEAIHGNIKRFIQYAGSMLDLSDYQNDKMLFKIEKHNLKTLLQSLEKKYSNILLKYDEAVPEVLEFDELKIMELFEELIENSNHFSSMPREKKQRATTGNRATKVTEAGGPIEFSLTKGEEILFDNKKWETIHISVKDSGVGVPLGELHRIFEPFYLSSATRDFSGGKGLGLSIAKEIIRGHFGKIYARMNRGPGLTIHIILPILHPKSDFLAGGFSVEVVPEIDLGKMISDMKNVENKFGGRKPRVLMIEDEKSVLLSAEMMVSALGYEFNGIMVGEEAVEYVQSKEFNADIVLLDMMLPDTTGLMVMHEIAEKLKALNVPVIIQSGLTEYDDNVQKTLALGAKGFIGKPYSRKDFQDIIKQMLRLG